MKLEWFPYTAEQLIYQDYHDKVVERVYENAVPNKYTASLIDEVFRHKPTGRFVRVSYFQDYNVGTHIDSAELVEVEAHTKTITEYRLKP